MISISTFILAVAMVESGNNPKLVGADGERSEYQITKDVWTQYTRKPFSKANTQNRALSRMVATAHAEHLNKHGFGTSASMRVYWMAVAWNCGETKAKKGLRGLVKIEVKRRDYATRVSNTYFKLMQEGK